MISVKSMMMTTSHINGKSEIGPRIVRLILFFQLGVKYSSTKNKTMARKRRRRKIRESQIKGRKKLQRQFESLKDPQTVLGQALCSVDQFEDFEEIELMKEEEVIIPTFEVQNIPVTGLSTQKETEPPNTSSYWWFSSFLRFF